MDKKLPNFSDDELKDVLRFHKKQQLQQHWETLMEEEDKIEAQTISLEPKKTPKLWLWAAAAIVAIVVGVFMVWILSSPPIESPQQLAMMNIDALVELPTKGSKLSSNQAIVTKLNQLKRKETELGLTKTEYTIIIALVNGQDEQVIKDNGFYLTKAYAYLKTGQYQSAIDDLKKYINDGQWTTDTAIYYLALSYIGLGDLGAAIDNLNHLKKEQPKKVNKLLVEIEEVRN